MYEGSEIMAILLLIAIELYLFYISYSYFNNSQEPFSVDINGELISSESDLKEVKDRIILPSTLFGKRDLEINEDNLNEKHHKLYKNGKLSSDKYYKLIVDLNKKNRGIPQEYTGKNKSKQGVEQLCLAGCLLDPETSNLHYTCVNPHPFLDDHYHCEKDDHCAGCGEKWPYSVETTITPLYTFKDTTKEHNQNDNPFNLF